MLGIGVVGDWFLGSYFIPVMATRIVGLLLLVAAGVIGVVGSRALRAAGTNVNPREPVITLVQQGPYCFTRNPLYLSILLLHLGIGVCSGGMLTIGMVIPLALLLHFTVVLREEAYLEAKFGLHYRRFCEQVPRWIGR